MKNNLSYILNVFLGGLVVILLLCVLYLNNSLQTLSTVNSKEAVKNEVAIMPRIYINDLKVKDLKYTGDNYISLEGIYVLEETNEVYVNLNARIYNYCKQLNYGYELGKYCQVLYRPAKIIKFFDSKYRDTYRIEISKDKNGFYPLFNRTSLKNISEHVQLVPVKYLVFED